MNSVMGWHTSRDDSYPLTYWKFPTMSSSSILVFHLDFSYVTHMYIRASVSVRDAID